MSLISLICLDTENYNVDELMETEGIEFFEIVRLEKGDHIKDLYGFFQESESEYICFIEDNQIFKKDRIKMMLKKMEEYKVDLVLSQRLFYNKEGKYISCPTYAHREALENTVFMGKDYIRYCLMNKINLYGNLSCMLVSTEYIKKIKFNHPKVESIPISKLFLLTDIIKQSNLCILKDAMVTTIVNQIENTIFDKDYRQYLKWCVTENIYEYCEQSKKNIEKEITFFVTDKGEYYNLLPLDKEAKKRGYKTKFTRNIQEKAEIGIYCQHKCFPENSKFSMILLHDMIQGHNRWPNIWEYEIWNKFDIGILPGEEWKERWLECSFLDYANPKKGVYLLGYPKGDEHENLDINKRVTEIKELWDFKYPTTILYAPSWENDEKEDDFILALSTLPVNLIVKQAHWNEGYSHIINNIKKMKELHKGKFDNLYYLEPEESIMVALKLCDLIISDESSVMIEGTLYGKPSIAVVDWLIPDQVPSRKANIPTDYVIKCKKVQLREYVEKFINNELKINMDKIVSKLYANRNNCCSDIMDCIDYYTQSGNCIDFKSKMVQRRSNASWMWM